jgi:hypothetical protein
MNDSGKKLRAAKDPSDRGLILEKNSPAEYYND